MKKKYFFSILVMIFAFNVINYADSWNKIGNDWYYVDSVGNTKIGLQQIDGKIYYFASTGKMQVGWQLINNSYYYFYQDSNTNNGDYGYMATNIYIDDFYVGADGVAVLTNDGRVPEYFSNEEKENAEILLKQFVDDCESFYNRFTLIENLNYPIYSKDQLYKILQSFSQDFDKIQMDIMQLYTNNYFMKKIYNEPASLDFGYFNTIGESINYINESISKAKKYMSDIMPLIDTLIN